MSDCTRPPDRKIKISGPQLPQMSDVFTVIIIFLDLINFVINMSEKVYKFMSWHKVIVLGGL